MSTPPTWRQTWLYVLLVGTLSAVTIVLLYGVFTAGFTEGVEAFLENPSGTVQENPLGLVGIFAVFVSLFALIGTVVLVGAHHVERETAHENR